MEKVQVMLIVYNRESYESHICLRSFIVSGKSAPGSLDSKEGVIPHVTHFCHLKIIKTWLHRLLFGRMLARLSLLLICEPLSLRYSIQALTKMEAVYGADVKKSNAAK